MRLLSVLVVALSSAACGPGPSPAGAHAGPVATVRLSPDGAAASRAPTVAIAPGSAQVRLLLAGVDAQPDALTAEIDTPATGDVSRWSVDPAPDGAGDGVRHSVLVPPYAVPEGRHALTLWAGDANRIATFTFTVVAREGSDAP
ncbi:MAG: hypothetical protein AB7O28_11930 [Vicinamibacterales bacterium]